MELNKIKVYQSICFIHSCIFFSFIYYFKTIGQQDVHILDLIWLNYSELFACNCCLFLKYDS